MTNRMLDKIDLLEDNLKKLKTLQQLSKAEFLSDFRNIESAKHLLQTSVEIMIDIANILVAKKRLGKPETSAESFEILAKNEIINSDNKKTYITMTKFRNRVVHMYSKVDDEEIYSILQNNITDYQTFIREVCQ